MKLFILLLFFFFFVSHTHTHTCRNLEGAPSHFAALRPIELLHQCLVIFPAEDTVFNFPFFTWLHFTAPTLGCLVPGLVLWDLAPHMRRWVLRRHGCGCDHNSKYDPQRGEMGDGSKVTGAHYWFSLKMWFFSVSSNPSKLIQILHSLGRQCLLSCWIHSPVFSTTCCVYVHTFVHTVAPALWGIFGKRWEIPSLLKYILTILSS